MILGRRGGGKIPLERHLNIHRMSWIDSPRDFGPGIGVFREEGPGFVGGGGDGGGIACFVTLGCFWRSAIFRKMLNETFSR